MSVSLDRSRAGSDRPRVWRARFGWPGPGLVRITVLDSNAFAPGGSWTYRISPEGSGNRAELRVERPSGR